MDHTASDDEVGPGGELDPIRVTRRIADMASALGPSGRGDREGGTKRRPTFRRTLSVRGHDHGRTYGPKTAEREARVLAHMARVQAKLAALEEADDAQGE